MDLSTLVADAERPVYDKYDAYLPTPLLKQSFIADRLASDEIIAFIAERDGVPYIL